MTDTVITIPLDAETARVYRAASTEDQRKIQLLLRLRLRELAELPSGSLRQVMDEIGAKAEARGLSEAVVEDELNRRGASDAHHYAQTAE